MSIIRRGTTENTHAWCREREKGHYYCGDDAGGWEVGGSGQELQRMRYKRQAGSQLAPPSLLL